MLRKAAIAITFAGTGLTVSVVGASHASALSPPWDGLPCFTEIDGDVVICPTPGPIAADPPVVEPLVLPDGSLPEIEPPVVLEPEVVLPPTPDPEATESGTEPAPEPDPAPEPRPEPTPAEPVSTTPDPVVDGPSTGTVESPTRIQVDPAADDRPTDPGFDPSAPPPDAATWPGATTLAVVLAVAAVIGLAGATSLGVTLGRRTVG